jgi:hypothetical protein
MIITESIRQAFKLGTWKALWPYHDISDSNELSNNENDNENQEPNEK